jgi:hypothetical protein
VRGAIFIIKKLSCCLLLEFFFKNNKYSATKLCTGEIKMGVHKVLSVFLCLLVLSAFTPNVLGTELSIVATADSYTDSDNPDVNHGGTSNLYSYYSELEMAGEVIANYEQYIWLKFDLSEIPSEATVNSITLRMHTSLIGTYSTNKVGVFLCSNTAWQEMTITWNNCPEVTGQSIDTVYVGTTDKNYDFEATSAVKGKSRVTLVLKTLEPTDLFGWAVFDSRESSWTNNRPRLIVEYTTPSQPLTLVPFFGFLIVTVIVISVVVISVVYAVIRKKKQPSPPTTPPTPSPTPS